MENKTENKESKRNIELKEEDKKKILLKQLEIAHRRDQEFGNYIMIVKGWTITLFSGIVFAYFKYFKLGEKELTNPILIAFISPFILFWTIEALMGAYQKPYYEAIEKFETQLHKNNKEKCKFIFLKYDSENDKPMKEKLPKNFLLSLGHLSVLPFYSIFVFLMFTITKKVELNCFSILSYIVILFILIFLSRYFEKKSQ